MSQHRRDSESSAGELVGGFWINPLVGGSLLLRGYRATPQKWWEKWFSGVFHHPELNKASWKVSLESFIWTFVKMIWDCFTRRNWFVRLCSPSTITLFLRFVQWTFWGPRKWETTWRRGPKNPISATITHLIRTHLKHRGRTQMIIVYYSTSIIAIGSMYTIYGIAFNIFYHQYTPFMLAHIPAPWIRHGIVSRCFLRRFSWFSRKSSSTSLHCRRQPGHHNRCWPATSPLIRWHEENPWPAHDWNPKCFGFTMGYPTWLWLTVRHGIL